MLLIMEGEMALAVGECKNFGENLPADVASRLEPTLKFWKLLLMELRPWCQSSAKSIGDKGDPYV